MSDESSVVVGDDDDISRPVDSCSLNLDPGAGIQMRLHAVSADLQPDGRLSSELPKALHNDG